MTPDAYALMLLTYVTVGAMLLVLTISHTTPPGPPKRNK